RSAQAFRSHPARGWRRPGNRRARRCSRGRRGHSAEVDALGLERRLTTATSDRIIYDPLIRRASVSMMEEAAEIAAAMGLRSGPAPDAMIERIRNLGAFKMSMLQDVERGKPVEIDALLTVIHDIGRLVGVPTPFIDSVLGLARLR